MKKTFVLVGLLMEAMSLGATELSDRIAAKFRITGQDDWYGCRRTVFDFDGYEAWVVEPPEGVAPATGNPWTWTMQWATAYVKRTSVPRLVKERGWRHATVITYKHRMDATGLEVSARFQKYLVDELGFAKKANLIGMSWGGFFSTRYAVTYPENVAKLWLDAPLLCFWDFDPKKEKTQSGYGPWAQMAPADGKWSNDPRMPLNMAERLAATRIPVYLVYGGQDKSCPPELNAIPFIERFKSAGGEDCLTVLYREYFGHHPHGVDVDDDTIIDYFCNRKEKDMRTAFERLSATVAGGERTATFLHAGGKAEQPWLKGVPECAVVEFTLRPTSESEIHCRLFLPPPAKWNGRFWGIGNTALGDSLDPLHVEALHLPRLREGAATCEADMGTANGRHGREVVRDFGWRSHHLMCVEAKKMIAEFYGRPAKKSYFYGVSSGGGQGLHEAQRFPGDYDGIVCYVPAHYRTRLAELGRADYRSGKGRDTKGFMSQVLYGQEAKSEYDMDDAEFAAFLDMIRPDVDASSTDLDAFVKRGGKLMIVSGLVDRIVPTETARDYCEALAKRYGGADRIAPFFRAYFLPGRGHTKAETADGVEDIPSAAAMVEWVERGKVPGPQQGQLKNGGSLTVAPWDGTAASAREPGSSFSREAFQKHLDSGEIPGVITVFHKNGLEETACLGYANVEERRSMSLDGVFQQCSQTKGFFEHKVDDSGVNAYTGRMK